MSWGTRAMPLAALVVALSGVSAGCAVDEYGRWGVPEPGYRPLTEGTFAEAMTIAMFRHRTAHMEMEVVDESMSMDVDFGDGDDDGEEFAMAGTYDDGKTVGEIVLVSGEVYVRDGGDTTYFQFPDALADQVIAQMELGNPKEIASDLASGIKTVDYGGSHEVAYGQTHRYDVTMQKEYLAEELDVPVERVPDLEYRMWLDDDDLLRRMTVEAMGAEVDVAFSDWGEPVTIDPPPSGQIEPLPMPSDEA